MMSPAEASAAALRPPPARERAGHRATAGRRRSAEVARMAATTPTRDESEGLGRDVNGVASASSTDERELEMTNVRLIRVSSQGVSGPTREPM